MPASFAATPSPAKLRRRVRVTWPLVIVVTAHAIVLSTLDARREPSGRGATAAAQALTVRSVAVTALDAPSRQPVPDSLARQAAVVSSIEGATGSRASGAEMIAASPTTDSTTDSMPAIPRTTAPRTTVSRSATSHANAPATTTPTTVARTQTRPPPAATPNPPSVTRAAPVVTTAAVLPNTTPAPTAVATSTLHDETPDSTDAMLGAAQVQLPVDALHSLPTYPVRLPPTQRLRFRVSRGDTQGEGVLDWSNDAGHYRAALRLRGVGLPGVDWTSEGDWGEDTGLLPRRMVAHRKGRPVAAANFALEERKVSFSGARTEQPFTRGGQDRLSWMLQLAGVLNARYQPLRDGERIVLYVVGPRGSAELWPLRMAGREALPDGDGTTAAIKLVREAQRLYDTELELWLDPARDHLPLRWRQQQRGVARPPLEWERLPG